MPTKNRADAAVAIATCLENFGVDLEDPNWQDTPVRFMKYLDHYFTPIDISKVFGSKFPVTNDDPGMVVQSNIPFKGMCCHHLLPMIGRAAIGYIPTKQVLGLSKLARLVSAVTRERPSLQEYYTERVADLMVEHLEPQGVIVVTHAEHGCMACRGIEEVGVHTTSSAIRGAFRHNHDAKHEFFQLLNVHSYAS